MAITNSPKEHAIKQTPNQRRLALLQSISLSVAQAETVEKAFADVLEHICHFMQWPLGHIYVWSEAADALVSSRIWFMADASTIAPFRQLSEATEFHRGEGTLGLVWESGQALSILDVRQETVFVRQMPVDSEGIRAYFAFPVMVNGKVTAVLEFFSPEPVGPDADMTSIINHVSALLGLSMERQQTTTLLQEREAQLAEAQRTAHVGHWEWDAVRNKVFWSDEVYNIYGVSPAETGVSYEAFIGRIHPSDLDYVRQKIEDALVNGNPFDYFHRIVRPDGLERVVHARGRAIRDENNKVTKLHGTVQDMTEQKAAELKLADTVRQLSALMEIEQAVAATLDLDVLYGRVLSLVRPLIRAEALILLIYKEEALEIVAMDRDHVPDMHGMRIRPSSSSILGEVWHTRQPLMLKGAECVQRLSPKLTSHTGYQPHALLAVPVRWQDKAMGILEAVHRDADAFNEEDLRLLEMAATWTAIAVGNARQYHQLQRQLSERDAIVTISNALTETLEVDRILQLIADIAQDIVSHADWTTIHLLQPRTSQLELAASAGLDLHGETYLINLGEGIVGQVMAEGSVVNIPDVQTHMQRLPIDLNLNARSLLVAPVESRYRRIGTISVQCATPATFTTDDERLLKILGVQAGMALENARLYSMQRRAREKAEKQRERMRHMARRVVKAQEEERTRIARELHDEAGQSLTSLKISLDIIRSMLPESMSEVRKSLTDVLEMTDQTMTNLRLLSHNLRPPGLDTYGLDAALAGLCQDFESHTTLTVTYKGLELPDLAGLSALTLYRFAQEALTNAAKHAEATEVRVVLTQDLDMIKLTVEDNGRGFIPPDLEDSVPAKGAGLMGMTERLEMVNGQLLVESEPGKGSRLTAVTPYIAEAT